MEIHTEEPLDWTLDGELEEGKNDFLIENIVNAIEIKAPEDN